MKLIENTIVLTISIKWNKIMTRAHPYSNHYDETRKKISNAKNLNITFKDKVTKYIIYLNVPFGFLSSIPITISRVNASAMYNIHFHFNTITFDA